MREEDRINSQQDCYSVPSHGKNALLVLSFVKGAALKTQKAYQHDIAVLCSLCCTALLRTVSAGKKALLSAADADMLSEAEELKPEQHSA